LALTSPTSGGRSVNIVRWRTKPWSFFFSVMQGDSKLLLGFPLPVNFQTGKLLTKYESVIQKVLFGNAVFAALMSGRKYITLSYSVRSFVSRLKIIGHGYPDNNLESNCVFRLL
jgi:hypothetical protein